MGGRRALALALGLLDPLPVTQDLGRTAHALRAEDVRVPAHHLVRDAPDHFQNREGPPVVRHLRVQDDLQQQVAQLFLKRAVVATVKGVEHLVGFLDEVRAEGVMRLFQVPGAARDGRPQSLNDAHQLAERLRGFIQVQVRFGSTPSPQKFGLPNRSIRWPMPWASDSSSRLWGTLRVLDRPAHAEIQAVADQHEGDVVERVRVALAQLVGPDDQRVVQQAAAAARLGRLGQPLGQVGQLLAVPVVDPGQLVLGRRCRCPACATARDGLRRSPASASARRRPSW